MARQEEWLVLVMHAKPEDPRRRQRRGYLGEGDHSLDEDEVHKH